MKCLSLAPPSQRRRAVTRRAAALEGQGTSSRAMTAEEGMSCMPMTRKEGEKERRGKGGRRPAGGRRGRQIEQQTNGIAPFLLCCFQGFFSRVEWPQEKTGGMRTLLNRTLPSQNLLYRNRLNRTLLNQETAKPYLAK